MIVKENVSISEIIRYQQNGLRKTALAEFENYCFPRQPSASPLGAYTASIGPLSMLEESKVDLEDILSCDQTKRGKLLDG